ncbi:phospholipid-transporting ATPase ABCA3-like [Anopheles aquasalis]|uniref:phospholipid-transporting ATPase ABCA3-like n=1 Tax=Anopheles aquasalis TaxID=42839 RepID=UPI00215AD83F|nr:phospholipid-transporting ATPase ABCA3-like [Anopheles aquasalis]XP_050098674.1 phospholipid-transporting ATPase ABCA3-like [Anopheles aquasalis]
MSTSSWGKFVLLLWKNWIITKRHYLQTLFEILIPILACVLLILIRGLVDAEQFKEPTVFKPLELNTISHLRLNGDISPAIIYTIGYSPQNPILESIVQRSVAYLDEELQVMGFANAQALQTHLQVNNMLVGVEFPDAYADIPQLPDQTILSLRYPSEMRTFRETGTEFWNNWQTERIFPAFQVPGARQYERDDAGYPANYYNETFLQIQSAISRSILLERAPNYQLPEVYLSRYPYPPFYSDVLLTGLENLLPLIIVIAFFYTCINTVKYITVEKERQLKEAMKIMGLSSWLHWSAWFVKCIALLLISISIITVLLCVSITTNTELAIFTFADWFAIWFYLFIYSLATITFCFMMSTFFSKANTASGIAGLMWFVFVMPYNIAFSNYDTMSLSAKLALCLFHNSAMSFGFMLIMRHEGTTNGLQWSNMFDPVTVDDDLSVGATMMMLLADTVIYLVIALYVEKVFPGEYGVAEPWYFPVTKKFWTNKVTTIDDGADAQQGERMDNIEPEPVGKHAGIRIRGLRKVFNKTKVAVKGLHLSMFEDQITVLLGHNGAGKTTTMSMLTGVFSPTSGTALINDCDIRTNIEGARKSLGLCPQHNVLFAEMTVAEHIRFFARLKGVERKAIPQEIDHYVSVLQLEDKRHAQSHTLSGGMKRKLAVGVALCGGSKVVFCDEPTSGMDPTARRALWDLLIQEKRGRTILLSTHFMDEADILGDRIAIMADGELKAAGSSFFLKKRFGVGYRLICVKDEGCDTARVTAMMRQHIGNMQVETDIGTELSYVLDDSHTAVFQPLLQDLESHSSSLGISSYGISLTTLEEVFLRVGSDSHTLDKKPAGLGPGSDSDLARPYAIEPSNGSTITLALESGDQKLLTGFALLKNQLLAMVLKKAIATKRSWIAMLVQIFIPIFFVIMTVVIVRSFPDSLSLPPLTISFDSYETTVTVLEGTATDPASTSLIQAYQQLFQDTGSSRTLRTISEPMVNYLLQRYDENLPQVNNQFMVAASITPTNHTIWFNAQAYHTAPLAVNTFYNAMLRTVCAQCSLVLTNHPLPFRPETRFTQLQAGNNMGFQLAFNTGFAMAFVAALYIMFYIKERVTRSKLLQFVSGANVLAFWAVSFLWDFLTFFITVMFYVAILAAFQEDGWSTGEEIGRVILVMMVFGFAFLPVTYLFSFIFDIPASGFVKMMILNIFTGTIFFMTVFLLLFDGFDLRNVAEGMEWAFLIFPLFALSHSLSNMNIAVATAQVCNTQCQLIPNCTFEMLCREFPQCCNTEVFTFERTGISRNLMYLFVVGLLSFLALLFIEYRVLDRVFRRKSKLAAPPADSDDIDSDVRAEKARVRALTEGEIAANNLVLRDVTKYYGKFLAVNQLSLAIEHSQCFGLLGVNGAGKTSTFKMMTGDESISFGEAWVNGISLKSNMNEVHRRIGYCPQFDALIDDLTGRETLRIFALLRGIPRVDIPALSLRLAEELNFGKHIDKQTKAYSGGNKRKLSTALALMGNPAVVYLDEPTTGMDPGARRQLWDVVCKERAAGKAIVLTSHSMEECEALCTRLAIMVNGEFKCLGSTQHLKNKFSNGYFLMIKLKRTEGSSMDRIEGVKRYIEERFPEAELKEAYLESVTYQIPSANTRWSTMFGLMEEAKKVLDIEDYALGQTSLEQVFLFFTKFQRETD